jgi:hypothetical protein
MDCIQKKQTITKPNIAMLINKNFFLAISFFSPFIKKIIPEDYIKSKIFASFQKNFL